MASEHYDVLSDLVARYRALSAENYARVRRLAEQLQSGFCGYLGAEPSPCVLLVPPGGPFEPKNYGDQAFSIPPKGFQPLGPISFGLAVRVSATGDWLRLALTCRKEGEAFTLRIEGGAAHTFTLPLADQDPSDFYELLRVHIENWFERAIADYEVGDLGDREIGFDFFGADERDAAPA